MFIHGFNPGNQFVYSCQSFSLQISSQLVARGAGGRGEALDIYIYIYIYIYISAGPSLEGPSGWEAKSFKSQVNVIVSFIVVIFQESFQHSIHSLM